MLADKRILAVVPARGGSKGVKLKNLRPVAGVPIVGLVGRLVARLPWIDRAVVSTDHEDIAAAAEAEGLAAPFRRPENLSGDIIGDLDVLTHALLAMEALDETRYDVVLMLQPTCPLRKPEHVQACAEKLVAGGFDAVWTLSETDSKAHPLKQLTMTSDKMDYYDPAGAKIIARQQLQPVFHRNGAAYAITRECLLDKRSIKGDNASAVVIDDFLVSIDTEFDFEYCQFVLDKRLGGAPF